MKIDASKVNLTEKDIEDWLYDNPNEIAICGFPVERWTHRQLRLPSGILDLMGVMSAPFGDILVIVELKNTPLRPEHLTQVSRYAYDIREIVEGILDPDANWHVEKVVFGTSCDDQVMREAEALGIKVVVFTPHVHLEVSGLTWTKSFRQERWAQYRALAKDEGLNHFVNMVNGKAAARQVANSLSIDDYDVVGEFEEAIRNATQGSAS